MLAAAVAVTLLCSALVASAAVGSASAADSSAVTVAAADQDTDIANAPFPGLEVTVSQTQGLEAQGIVVSWTGAALSQAPSGQNGGANFLQVMQCWGDDPDHPGEPDRRTCQYGGVATPGATRDSVRSGPAAIAAEDTHYSVPAQGFASPAYTSIPFLARSGEVISSITDTAGVRTINSTNVNSNKFFTKLTTNEVPWAGSATDGTGTTKFEVQTLAQSPGLGCGAPVTATDGSVSGASCWLVVVPRGEADVEENSILRSGLFWDAWKHRVAVKLDFRPLGVRCAIGASERQLSGSELVGAAVASWQPALCNASGGSIYSLITGAESDAALAANGKATAPLALTSRPLSGTTDTLKYAPIALTGVTIAFSIDRFPSAFGGVPQDALDKSRLPFTDMKLTPRLLAKLLTNSYQQSLPSGGDRSHLGYTDPSDPATEYRNPQNLTSDPDFLAINDPEWAYQSLSSPAIADLLVPQGRSDAAWQVWSYILADPEARDFLAGVPDPWHMIVNPWSSIDAAKNSSGTALQLPRDNFPKSDPIEVPSSASGGEINLVTWRPYTNDLDTSAYLTLRGDGQVLGAWDILASPAKYTKTSRDLTGFQKVIGLTDTASAARYAVVTVALKNPAGAYVSASNESLLAAASAMTPSSSQSQVFGFDPTSTAAKTATAAYPLAMPVFAAASPKMTDAATRASYAAFIRYASTTGQTSGVALGQLPAGYAPIPTAWRALAESAAATIQSGGTATAALPTKSATTVKPKVTAPTVATTTGAAETDPQASGDTAGPLSGAATKDDPAFALVSATVPLAGGAGILALLLIPLISRIRRRL